MLNVLFFVCKNRENYVFLYRFCVFVMMMMMTLIINDDDDDDLEERQGVDGGGTALAK